jgi:Leucine rich repeat
LKHVGRMPSTIVTLDLAKNYITTLPLDFFKTMQNLKTLDLSFNLLTRLPDIFGSELQTLNCRKNKLCEFPNIQSSTGLKFLDLSFNLICSLPEDCFDFQHNLIKVLLNENPIIGLPDLSDLMSLTTLDISSTNITSLPSSLASLAHLKTLYLVPPFKSIPNPLEPGRKSDFEKYIYPPPEIVIKGLLHIQKFLQADTKVKKMVTITSSETLNDSDKPLLGPKKGNLEEFDCLIDEFDLALSRNDSNQTKALYSLMMTFIHDLIRPHILNVFLNSGMRGKSHILRKFTIRVEKIMSRFDKPNFCKFFKPVVEKIFEIVEINLFNSMLMKRDLAKEINLNLVSDVIRVWSLFAWENYSIQTMEYVQDLVLIGKSVILKTKLKAQTNLTTRQVEKWLSYFESGNGELLELDYLNESQELYKSVVS